MSETPRHNTRVPEGIDKFEKKLRDRMEALGFTAQPGREPDISEGDIAGFVSQTCSDAREYADGALLKLVDRFYDEGYDRVQEFMTDAREAL